MNPEAVLKEALMQGLRTGEWQPGFRIPTERQLSERFAIGRSAVRRVLGQLKAQSLITQTVGSGTYVSHDVASLLPSTATQRLETSPSALMEARIALEPAIVSLVVAHGTAADFARMDDCCARAEAAQGLEEFEHWDHGVQCEPQRGQSVLRRHRPRRRQRRSRQRRYHLLQQWPLQDFRP